jgi:competence ComEA-like helix-hairpin-helix protein
MKSLIVFSRVERNGTLTLGFLSLAMLILPAFSTQFTNAPASNFSEFQQEIAAFRTQIAAPPAFANAEKASFAFDPNTASADDFIALGLSEPIANRICNYREKGGKFRKPEDFSKMYGLATADFERLLPFINLGNEEKFGQNFSKNEAKRSTENFPFDPNVASENDFLRLGLDARTAKSILNYREKGGVFRKKADFAKIYTLDEADFTRLEPMLQLPEKAVFAQTSPAPSTYSTDSKPPSNPAFGKPKLAVNSKIDINKSTAEEWKQVPGIGQVFSQKITAYREKLGGFYEIGQVAETKGLPDSTFQKILPFLKFETPIYRKININSATVEQFVQHPYFDKKLAETIVAYRENHGAFKKIDDLRTIRAVRLAWFEQISAYLTTE